MLDKPWSFDKHPVILQRYDKDMGDLKFDRVFFWVQVRDIPIRFMRTEVAKGTCDTIGEVSRSIGTESEEGGSFM